MTGHDLAPFVTAFFTRHLPAERNASPHTIAAYRDTLKLLLRSLARTAHRDAAALRVEDLTPEHLLQFLTSLETTRHNSIRTRNARLAAIHSFVRYVLDSEPALAALGQRLLAVPFKKTVRPVLGYLSERALAQLLAEVDRTTPAAERDYLLLALLYDTGARIQEILDVAPRDFRLVAPPFVRLRGKGQRERLCPLLPQTARLVTRYLATRHLDVTDRAPLLQNRRSDPLTRHGARYLLAKYVQRARAAHPSLFRDPVSPHTLRHTKAMHLLQAGVPLITIKDLLGHADVKSTEVYVQIDLEMKRDALASASTLIAPSRRVRRPPRDLIAWLEAL
jgi:integrase/recombinase XerD